MTAGQGDGQSGQAPGQGATAEKPNDFNAGQGGEGGQGAKIAMRERAHESHANAGEAPYEKETALSHGTSIYSDHSDHSDHTKNETGFSGQGAPPALDHHDQMPAGAGVCPVCNEVRWLRAGPITTVCDACALLALVAVFVR